MDGWVDEAAGSDGHRTIINSVGGDQSVAGFGHAGSSSCFDTFDVGDFGPATTAPPTLASAAPKPISGKAGTFTIYATWNDPAGGAPADLNAVVDGACTPMTLELGDPKLNATYKAAMSLGAGCHSVFVVGDSAAHVRSSYPTTTAFTIPVGGATCADEVAQPASACAGVDGGTGSLADGGAGSDGSAGGDSGGAVADGGRDGGGTAHDAGGTSGDGGGSTGAQTDGGGGPSGGSDGGAVTSSDDGGSGSSAPAPSTTKSGCACGIVAPADAGGAWGGLAVAGLVLARSPRRRARR
jgi:hypothetical protein